MDINFSRTLQDLAKQLETFVEKKLGDRSKIEEQVRGFVRAVESTVTEAVRQRRGDVLNVEVRVQKLETFRGDLPKYQSAWASGFDVRAQLASGPITLQPGERSLIPTGLCFEIPLGYELQARPRSGLAIKQGVSLVNTPGTIDADYRGEVKIILINLGQQPVTINDQDRIAQLVLAPVVQASFIESDSLSATERGAGGFGSTGHSEPTKSGSSVPTSN